MSARCCKCYPDVQAPLLVRQGNDETVGPPKYLCIYHILDEHQDPDWTQLFILADLLISQSKSSKLLKGRPIAKPHPNSDLGRQT